MSILIPTPIISQLVHLVIVSKISAPIVEEMAYFGDDTVVSLGEYFWSKTEKAVGKKGSKQAREGTFMEGTVPN